MEIKSKPFFNIRNIQSASRVLNTLTLSGLFKLVTSADYKRKTVTLFLFLLTTYSAFGQCGGATAKWTDNPTTTVTITENQTKTLKL